MQFHQVTGRISEQNQFGPDSGDDVGSKVDALFTQLRHFFGQIFYLELDAIPAARLRLATVRGTKVRAAPMPAGTSAFYRRETK